jgi:hypothetical protein
MDASGFSSGKQQFVGNAAVVSRFPYRQQFQFLHAPSVSAILEIWQL